MFDAHLHIIDPRFPLVENDGYLPEPFTVDDYLALPESEVKVELCEGNLVVSPSASTFHQRVGKRLMAILDRQLMPDHESAYDVDTYISHHTMRRPDVFVSPRERFEAKYHELRPGDVVIAVEIVSPSSRSTDRILKPAEYASVGIPGYWRVELDPVVMLTAYSLTDGVYAELGTWGPGETAEITEPLAVTIPIDDLVGDRQARSRR